MASTENMPPLKHGRYTRHGNITTYRTNYDNIFRKDGTKPGESTTHDCGAEVKNKIGIWKKTAKGKRRTYAD